METATRERIDRAVGWDGLIRRQEDGGIDRNAGWCFGHRWNGWLKRRRDGWIERDRCSSGQGRLLRTWKDGEGKIPAFLEDEAYLANALLDLADGAPRSEEDGWLQEATRCIESLRRRFRRRDGPGFSLSGEGHEALHSASRDLFDKATPSASGAAALALARRARRIGNAGLAWEAVEAVGEVPIAH